jgi:PEP-CTERM motif-containing protein
LLAGEKRGLRGGAFDFDTNFLQSSYRLLSIFSFPTVGLSDGGFRLASAVPEPSTGVLALIACGLMWWWRKRFDICSGKGQSA